MSSERLMLLKRLHRTSMSAFFGFLSAAFWSLNARTDWVGFAVLGMVSIFIGFGYIWAARTSKSGGKGDQA